VWRLCDPLDGGQLFTAFFRQAADAVGDDDMLLSVSPLAKRKLLAPLATICGSPELEAHPEAVLMGALGCIETFVEMDKLHLINQVQIAP